MQLVLTEKQFKKLALQFNEDELISEEGDDAAAAAPESGTSSDGENKTGASKWESGATRGPGNQIGVTKWSDVVGSTLKRGKANPLSEQAKPQSKSFIKPVMPKVSSDYFATVDSYNKRRAKDSLTPYTKYVYKADDGQNFFVNLVNGQLEEAILDLREFLMDDISIGVEIFLGTVFSETVAVPVAIAALNGIVLFNDIHLYSIQGENDEQSLIRIIEDCLILAGMGAIKIGSMGLKAWLKNRSNLRKLITLRGTLSNIIQSVLQQIKRVKLPEALKKWLSSKISLLQKLPQIIDKLIKRVGGATPSAVARYASSKFNKALFAGFVGYIGAKALNKLLGLPSGTVEKEMSSGKFTENTEKAFNGLKLTTGQKQENITNQNELEKYKKDNNRIALAKKVAEVNKKAYPCLLTYLKNGRFEVQLTSNKGYIYKINNKQYYVNTFGIYDIDTDTSFEC
jgi:hypothetical protein